MPDPRRAALITWLLDSDPALRWQVLRDLTDADPATWQAERRRAATTGWGAALLDRQGADGRWDGSVWRYPAWGATHDAVGLMRELGLPPDHPRVRAAITAVETQVDWGAEWQHSPFFHGEVEACINGRTLAAGAAFHADCHVLADRLIREQLDDGGWNCYTPGSRRGSFHSTLCVLEGLLEYHTHYGPSPALTAARARGDAYLLERRLLRRLSTGELVDPTWTLLAFPTRWHYDLLWALDYLRRAGHAPDPRLADAIHRLEAKRDPDGRWRVEILHGDPLPAHLPFADPVGQPSRWLTLRALRVLDWYHGRP